MEWTYTPREGPEEYPTKCPLTGDGCPRADEVTEEIEQDVIRLARLEALLAMVNLPNDGWVNEHGDRVVSNTWYKSVLVAAYALKP